MKEYPKQQHDETIQPHSKEYEALQLIKQSGELMREPGDRPMGDLVVHFYSSQVSGTWSYKIVPYTGFIEPQVYLAAVHDIQGKRMKEHVGGDLAHLKEEGQA